MSNIGWYDATSAHLEEMVEDRLGNFEVATGFQCPRQGFKQSFKLDEPFTHAQVPDLKIESSGRQRFDVHKPFRD
jgi:hypothetical protein